MFDRLFDWIFNFIELFYITFIVDEYEEAVVLRFGKYVKTVGPGLHFQFPFGIDRPITTSVVYDTMTFYDKVVTLKDGVTMSYGITVGFTVSDAKKYLLDVEGAEEAMTDSVMMLAPPVLMSLTWPQVLQEESRDAAFDALRTAVAYRVRRFGIKVEAMGFNSVAKARVFYLMKGQED